MKFRNLFFFGLILFVIASCTKDKAGLLRVKYYNETGFDLKGLKINGEKIGRLDQHEQTKVIVYHEFGFDTGMPDVAISAQIENQEIHSFSELYWCGTQKEQVKEGTYEFELVVKEFDGSLYFDLEER